MQIDTTPDVSITYGQLESALKRLGYARIETGEYRAFKQGSTDTLLLFPSVSDDQRVPFHHLQMARVNSVMRGVTDERAFDDALNLVVDSRILVPVG